MDQQQPRIDSLEIMIQNLIVASYKRQYGGSDFECIHCGASYPNGGHSNGCVVRKAKELLGCD